MNRFNSPKEKPLLYTCYFLSVLMIAAFIALLLASYWPGPYLDYWADTKNVENLFNGIVIPGDLLAAHNNAHRILIPRILFYLDFKFFSGSNLLIIATGIGCKLLSLWLFNKCLCTKNITERAVLNVLMVFGIFNLANVYNIIFSSDIQWDLMILFSMSSIYFYQQNYLCKKNNIIFMLSAYTLYLCGVFSQAGAAGVIFVFFFISLINKKFLHLVIASFILFSLIKINGLLPLSLDGTSEFNKATATIIFNTIAVIRYMYYYIPGAASNQLHSNHYLFIYFVFIFFFSLYSYIKTPKKQSNSFFLFSLLFLIMIFSIAASRSNWRPGSWVVSRYQILPIMLWLTTSLAALSYIPNSKQKIHFYSKAIIILILIYILSINTFKYYKEPIALSNKVLQTHANMFFHGVTQKNALSLWPFVKKDRDPIAEPDAFFRKNNLAYYTNKQIINNKDFVFLSVGDNAIAGNLLEEFSKSCLTIPSQPVFIKDKKNNTIFDLPLAGSLQKYFFKLFSRNTYYALNDQGTVIGFTYLKLNENTLLSLPSLAGIVSEQSITFIADADADRQLHCIYKVNL